MNNPEINRYEKQQITSPEKLFTAIKETLQKGQRIAIINDFDDTVSSDGPSKGDNPFDRVMHAEAGQALAAIENSGGIIGAISNRSGEQIAGRYYQAGIKKPFIVGTYGFEVYQPDTANPNIGKSVIDARFNPFRKPITLILSEVKKGLLTEMDATVSKTDTPEVTISTPVGPIYLENKGLNREFTEGIAQVYNLNHINPQVRTRIVERIKESYSIALDEILQQNAINVDVFKRTWGMSESNNSPDQPGRYSISIEPLVRQGKAYGMTRLLRAVQNSSLYPEPIGLIMYGGDANADAEAMRAGKLLERYAKGRVKSVGVWVYPNHEQAHVRHASDMVISGVDAYARTLQELSSVIKSTT